MDMTLRDQFAAQALAAFIARGSLAAAVLQAQEEARSCDISKNVAEEGIQKVARGAYRVADAMLAARSAADYEASAKCGDIADALGSR